MALTVNHQHYDWWHALVAGLNERCSSRQGLLGLSDDFLKGMLAFDIANPVSSYQDGADRWLVHPWRTALTERRPELVRDAYLAVAHLRLSRNEQFIDGLSELLTEAAFEPYRRESRSIFSGNSRTQTHCGLGICSKPSQSFRPRMTSSCNWLVQSFPGMSRLMSARVTSGWWLPISIRRRVSRRTFGNALQHIRDLCSICAIEAVSRTVVTPARATCPCQ